MKNLIRAHDWLMRTCFCTLWLISGAFFIFNGASGLAETDPIVANDLMIRAGYFGGVMVLAMLLHAHLVMKYKEKYPPEDGNYPDWDM